MYWFSINTNNDANISSIYLPVMLTCHTLIMLSL